jgi:3-methylcrotonyl-CoA carboxylase alpha subunit
MFENIIAYGQTWPPLEAPLRAPWIELRGFRLNGPCSNVVHMRWRGKHYAVALDAKAQTRGAHGRSDGALCIFENGEAYEFTLDTGEAAGGGGAVADGDVRAPMPGKVVSVSVKKGASVKQGDALLTLEAMKMEHALTAPFDGIVAELNVKSGAQVVEGALLVKLEKT